MDKKALEAFAREASNLIKTPSDLDDFRKMLTKVTVETALNAELDEHLGYEKHSLTTDGGEIQLDIPTNRDSPFEPKIVRKHQTRF